MSADEWQNLQEALLAIYGPIGAWLLVWYVVGNVFLAINVIWLTLLRYMGRRF